MDKFSEINKDANSVISQLEQKENAQLYSDYYDNLNTVLLDTYDVKSQFAAPGVNNPLQLGFHCKVSQHKFCFTHPSRGK